MPFLTNNDSSLVWTDKTFCWEHVSEQKTGLWHFKRQGKGRIVLENGPSVGKTQEENVEVTFYSVLNMITAASSSERSRWQSELTVWWTSIFAFIYLWNWNTIFSMSMKCMAVISHVVFEQESSAFESQLGDFLGIVGMFSLCLRGLSLGTQHFLHIPETYTLS